MTNTAFFVSSPVWVSRPAPGFSLKGIIMKSLVDVVVDGQWGSTGKGKLCSYLAKQCNYAAAVSDNMPNAGHTAMVDGHTFVFKVLPSASLFCEVAVIGPHAVFDPKRLAFEIVQLQINGMHRLKEVLIHPNASILLKSHAVREKVVVGRVASTGQGSSAAVVDKIRRTGDAVLARDVTDTLEKNVPGGRPVRVKIADTVATLNNMVENGKRVLLEGSQGFDLSLNHGWEYPYVTSRDCMTGRIFDNAGLSPRWLRYLWMSVRTFPIRVGNVTTDDGEEVSSGPFYLDQKELSWEIISKFAGQEVRETTTVTKRVRRVFSWSNHQIIRALTIIRPTHMFLNFVNYFNGTPNRGKDEITRVQELCNSFGANLMLLGTGPGQSDMVTYEEFVHDDEATGVRRTERFSEESGEERPISSSVDQRNPNSRQRDEGAGFNDTPYQC